MSEEDALRLQHACCRASLAAGSREIRCEWQLLDLGFCLKENETRHSSGRSSSPTKISRILENNKVSLPADLGNCQEAAATSAIFSSQAFLFSLITPKRHPWSSLLSLRAASSAVAFFPKARNLKLIHVHVSPTNVCVYFSVF